MRILGPGVFACFALLISSGSAQEFRATLNGAVSDAQDARIPGASIELTNAATGAKFTTVSSASGQYTVPLLPRVIQATLRLVW